jgi:hypothetical protein
MIFASSKLFPDIGAFGLVASGKSFVLKGCNVVVPLQCTGTHLVLIRCDLIHAIYPGFDSPQSSSSSRHCALAAEQGSIQRTRWHTQIDESIIESCPPTDVNGGPTTVNVIAAHIS